MSERSRRNQSRQNNKNNGRRRQSSRRNSNDNDDDDDIPSTPPTGEQDRDVIDLMQMMATELMGLLFQSKSPNPTVSQDSRVSRESSMNASDEEIIVPESEDIPYESRAQCDQIAAHIRNSGQRIRAQIADSYKQYLAQEEQDVSQTVEEMRNARCKFTQRLEQLCDTMLLPTTTTTVSPIAESEPKSH